MLSTMMTQIPMVLGDTMTVFGYFDTKFSDFIMVSANVLGLPTC